MKKMKETANKGFSLVELIIVIAIMAILIGVLAPQFLKYVEKSRQSTDMQSVDAIVSAIEVYAIDPDVETGKTVGTAAAAGAPKTAEVTLKTEKTKVSATNATSNANLALTNAGITELVLKSDKWPKAKEGLTITFTIDNEGNVTPSCTDCPEILEGKAPASSK